MEGGHISSVQFESKERKTWNCREKRMHHKIDVRQTNVFGEAATLKLVLIGTVPVSGNRCACEAHVTSHAEEDRHVVDT